MRTVFKYPFDLRDEAPDMPAGHKLLHVGYQGFDPSTVMLWAEVEVDNAGRPLLADEPSRYVAVGTGHRVPSDAVHQASVIAGAFVWHIYRQPA